MHHHAACMSCIFFFNDTATTEIYTLSLHDALPISLPNRIETSSESKLATARSGCPSPLKSPTAREEEPPRVSNVRSEEHTSELQSPCNLVCRLLLEKKKKQTNQAQ